MAETISGTRGQARLSELFLAALALTGLNALKPLHVDDVIWSYFAQHIAEHPAAPFDFTIPWHQSAQSARNVMAPPFLPYWWAAAIRVVGDSPALWKVSLLPIHLLLACSLSSLARRFASPFARPLVWAMMLSPTILPSANLMLDIPNLTFVLASVALFLDACENNSSRRALMSGVLLGLALLTKWNAFVGIPTLVLAALLFAPTWRWALVPLLSIAIFVAWEGYLFATIGESHFLHHARHDNPMDGTRSLVLPLITLTGALAPLVPLLVMCARGMRPRYLAAFMGVYALGLTLIAIIPAAGFSVRLPLRAEPWTPRPEMPFFLALGLSCWAAAMAAFAVVGEEPWGNRSSRLRSLVKSPASLPIEERLGLFLMVWLAIEVAGYCVFSPFPAARRVIGLVVPLTLLAGHVASRRRAAPAVSLRWVWAAAGFQIAAGGLFFLVDTLEALSARRAAEDTRAWVDSIRERTSASTLWFNGSHGFEFYAMRNGMRPMLAGQSQLEPGDFLAIQAGDSGPAEQQVTYDLDKEKLVLLRELTFADGLPLSTWLCYYLGQRPIEHQEGPRTNVSVYRVLSAYAPQQPERITLHGSSRAQAAP